MQVGDTVTVTCTDTGADHQGVVERVGRGTVSVSINPRLPLIVMHYARKNLWLGFAAGLEFIIEELRR